MYNLILALAAGLVLFVAVGLWLGWVAAILPALAIAVTAMFLLSRRTSRLVEAELATLPALLQNRRIDEAQTKLVHVKERYGRWQFLLAGMMDVQLGLIDYLQLRFAEAKPKLESGKWRNGVALTCLGCIDYRNGNKDGAWKNFAAATAATTNDPMLYVVRATLLARDGLRAEALAAVSEGLGNLPDSQVLRDLKNKIANKQKIDIKAFGEGWFQYFPEELVAQMSMRGTRGGPSPLFGKLPQQPRPGARHAPRR
jgi:hypothetical protein